MTNKLLGDYELIKEVGQGSLGRVYWAEHRFMKKHFIIKVLPDELSDDRGFMQRFEEEVSVLSSLDHPNIVKIHNVSFAEGKYFLVLDCVVDEKGETTNLSKYLLSKSSKLDEKELLKILTQVASALEYSHTKNIGGRQLVHRSLKPNNVLIGVDEEGNAKALVSDFGLSRIVGVGAVLSRTFKAVAEALELQHAATSTISGYTPEVSDAQKLGSLHASFLQNFAFLSPEQKNVGAQVDAAADRYAFGVLVYYMLFGSAPEGIFTMPSEALDLKADWDSLLLTCLQKDPAKRTQNLVELLTTIRAPAQKTAEELQIKAPEEELVYSGKLLKPVICTSKLERPEVDPDPASVFKVDPTVKVYHQEDRSPKNVIPLESDMVVVEGGSFWRGCNDGNRDEMPRHKNHVKSFAIDISPVSNEQFARFLEAMGGEKDRNHSDLIRLKESRLKRMCGKISIESGFSKHPIVGVTWYGAYAYAEWVGKRLPFEVEWEIASRGGIEDAIYPTGDSLEKTQANFFSSDTTAVMSYQPNDYGIYDMAGNVWEWCYDWYDYNYYETSNQEPENPRGPKQGVYRVLKGGCWKSLKEDLRCSKRHRNNPGTVNSTYGFRCATDVH